MARRSVIVRSGAGYRRRSQVQSGAGHVPRYRNIVSAAGGKPTAFRHVRRRYERYRKKGIRIRLYRGDGVEITGWNWDGDGAGEILTFLSLRNSDDEWIAQTVEYNEDTQYWEMSVDNKEDEDSKGYWIVWRCDKGRLGNYPYRYFPVWDAVGAVSNLRQEDDLVKSGDLVDIIPYFAHTTHSDSSGYCSAGNPGFSASSQKWIVASSSVDYYVRYRIPARPSVVGLAVNCQGRGWTLSCSEFNYTVPDDGKIPSEISAFASEDINVQISQNVVDLIIDKIGGIDAFNAQFPSISIGEGGISTDTFAANFTEGGDYDIATNTFSSPIPYTLDF